MGRDPKLAAKTVNGAGRTSCEKRKDPSHYNECTTVGIMPCRMSTEAGSYIVP